MRSSTGPVLRALRRLAAGDPEQPVHPDFRTWQAGLQASLTELSSRISRPARHALDELLGGSRTLPDTGAAKILSGGDTAGDRAVALVATHRRSATAAICLLLVAAAAIAAVPLASASGSSATSEPSAALDGVDVAQIDVAASGDPGAQADVGDIGDAAVYNVMQAGDIGPVGVGFQVYVVKGGDTLAKIGARFSLSSGTVYWANTSRLPNPNSLRVGQKLAIPPANGVTVTVKAGDTLSGYASRYKTSTKAIMAANGLTDATVTVGQLLLIPATPPAIPAPKPASGGGYVWTGAKLRWPVPASHTITQYYSASRHPAIDIGANTGTPVVAAVSGTVIWSGWKTSGGGYGGGIEIWVNSGGRLYTTYNHLSHTYVKVGQRVTAGQHIGNVGMTGNATGPHLHFEVWTCYPWTGGTTACARNPLSFM